MQNMLLLQTMEVNVMDYLQEVKSQQASLLAPEASKIIFRSRVHSVEQDETWYRFFFQKVHRESSVLCSLKEKDGSVTSPQSGILRISKSFYTRLYDPKPTDSTASQSFLSSIRDLWILEDSTVERLDQPISLGELTKALESFEKNKTPGSDGLPAELYSAVWDLIGQDLLEVYDNILRAGTMCEPMRKGIITLMYKQKADYLKVLDIWIGGAGACGKTWEEHVTNVRQKLGKWEYQSLSIAGKNLVIRCEVLSVLLYVAQ
eukprot:g29817.t1